MQKKLKLMTDFIINGIAPIDDKLVMTLSAPYSLKSVTIYLNPSVSYKNNGGKEYLGAKYTPSSKKLTFNLKNNASKKIKIAGINYKITLTDIGKIKKKNYREIFYFKFTVNKD
jgi:hypothetical protein